MADQETTTAGTPEAVRVLEREAMGRYRAKYPEGIPWHELDASTRWVWVAYTETQRSNAGVPVAGEAPPSDAAILAIASSVGMPSSTGADTLVLFARALLAACAPRGVGGTLKDQE